MSTDAAKTAPATKPEPAAKAANRPKLRYHDRVDLAETFADSIRTCIFDGQAARIEFTVGRFDDPGALGIVEGKQVPVARLVLPAPAMLDLLNRLGQIAESMRRSGLLKPAPTDGKAAKN